MLLFIRSACVPGLQWEAATGILLMKTMLFDMHSGVSGDMILGALFDLGVDFDAWNSEIAKLGLPVKVKKNAVMRSGMAATYAQVEFPHEVHTHRGLSEISTIISSSELNAEVKRRSLAIFQRLAEVEARIHGVTPEEVHFHELGALDTIVDITGACIGFEMLGIEEFFCTSFPFGKGSIRAAHGNLPLPAPATLALTEGFPSHRTDITAELCTPTGAAIVTHFARPLPSGMPMRLRRIGYGAGTRDLPDGPNVLRLCLMEKTDAPPETEVFQVECNIDNMPPDWLAHASGLLFEGGCRDVWQEPIYMKKNRAAVKLCALVDTEKLDAILSLFVRELLTGGVRYYPVKRLVAEKSETIVSTPWGDLRAKRVTFPAQGIERVEPEYESLRTLAAVRGIPLHVLHREVMEYLKSS